MNRFHATTVLCAALAVVPSAFACGEGHFNMGQGMRYQGYLAPRPATVLVLVDPSAPAAERQKVIKGLEQAGHRVTLASNTDALASAMGGSRFDVVIADIGQAEAVQAMAASAPAKPRLVPVVARSERNSTDLRSRFPLHLFDGASLGQYLKAINQAMASSP
jgi:CheY-like chemotaxis protein